jgi:hypothetical protein
MAAGVRGGRLADRGEVRLMGFNNPSVRWSEMARLLGSPDIGGDKQPDGGDGPAFSRKRGKYEPPRSNAPRMPCPTPSCTRTRRSPSSTARPRRPSWRKRPNGWAARARDHRPRRVLRHRPFRRGGGAPAAEDRLRGGADARRRAGGGAACACRRPDC